MPTKDFFISYSNIDEKWAVWIAWQLEEAGYTTGIQAWDFTPGSDFVEKMHDAFINAERTIAVLSNDYLKSAFAQAEWSAAFSSDPTGEKGHARASASRRVQSGRPLTFESLYRLGWVDTGSCQKQVA